MLLPLLLLLMLLLLLVLLERGLTLLEDHWMIEVCHGLLRRDRVVAGDAVDAHLVQEARAQRATRAGVEIVLLGHDRGVLRCCPLPVSCRDRSKSIHGDGALIAARLVNDGVDVVAVVLEDFLAQNPGGDAVNRDAGADSEGIRGAAVCRRAGAIAKLEHGALQEVVGEGVSDEPGARGDLVDLMLLVGLRHQCDGLAGVEGACLREVDEGASRDDGAGKIHCRWRCRGRCRYRLSRRMRVPPLLAASDESGLVAC